MIAGKSKTMLPSGRPGPSYSPIIVTVHREGGFQLRLRLSKFFEHVLVVLTSDYGVFASTSLAQSSKWVCSHELIFFLI